MYLGWCVLSNQEKGFFSNSKWSWGGCQEKCNAQMKPMISKWVERKHVMSVEYSTLYCVKAYLANIEENIITFPFCGFTLHPLEQSSISLHSDPWSALGKACSTWKSNSPTHTRISESFIVWVIDRLFTKRRTAQIFSGSSGRWQPDIDAIND